MQTFYHSHAIKEIREGVENKESKYRQWVLKGKWNTKEKKCFHISQGHDNKTSTEL